jgi:CPA2 family monovalent cation:H+ antiporter-2
VPVLVAVLLTIVLNIGAGQFVAWINGLGVQAGINTTVILQNRGEFALILATLSLAAGLDERIQPFAGLYVLIMAVIGPILAANSEKIGAKILRSGPKRRRVRKKKAPDRMIDEEIALVDAATADLDSDARRDAVSADETKRAVDQLVERAMQQDSSGERERD